MRHSGNTKLPHDPIDPKPINPHKMIKLVLQKILSMNSMKRLKGDSGRLQLVARRFKPFGWVGIFRNTHVIQEKPSEGYNLGVGGLFTRNSDYQDNGAYMWVLLFSYYTTITGCEPRI